MGDMVGRIARVPHGGYAPAPANKQMALETLLPPTCRGDSVMTKITNKPLPVNSTPDLLRTREHS